MLDLLHTHPKLEEECNIPTGHVIVDVADHIKVMEYIKRQKGKYTIIAELQ